MNAARRISGNAQAQAELDRALKQVGAARREQLAALAGRHPGFGPVWVALAEDHLRARRVEEAQQAARRAIKLDPGLARGFSPELERTCASLLPRPAPRAAVSAPRPAPQRTRAGNPGAELAQATRLHGLERAQRLDELTRKYPDHGPTWLALAEESLAQRRIGQAMAALERALALDPELERLMSPKLESAQRYSKKESHAPVRPGPARPGARPGHNARPDEATRRARRPGPAPRPAARPPGRVGKLLARALELRDRDERLEVLRKLWDMAPDNPAVLFHVAIESALAGHLDDARRAGRDLHRVSPSRYEQLYSVAESYWPSQRSELDATVPRRRMPAPPSAPASPPASAQKAPANARTMCMQVPASLPAPMTTPGGSSHPAMQLQALGAGPQKTQILGVAPGPVARMSAVPTPESTTALAPRRPVRRTLRTAGALAAGVAAGLLIVMLVVFMLGRTNVLKTLSTPWSHSEPAAAQTSAQTSIGGYRSTHGTDPGSG